MINTILVATDGSEHAQKALDLAADIAAKYGARMVLLHVMMRDATPADVRRLVDVTTLPADMQEEIAHLERVPTETASISGVYTSVPVPVPRNVVEAVGERITGAAREAASAKGVKEIDTVLVDGDPARRILERAEAEGADMIVMGSRGFGDFKGLLVGSVSHKVSHLAKCTCVTVK